MPAVAAFGSLKFANRLKEAGVPASQAEAHAYAMGDIPVACQHDLATKGDIAALKADVAAVRAELKADIAVLREEFKDPKQEILQEFESFKKEMDQRFDSFKFEVRTDISAFREEVKAEFKQIRTEFHGGNKLNRWILGALFAGVVALVLMVVRLSIRGLN